MVIKSKKEFESRLKKKINGISFSFGKNWQNYLKSLTKEKVSVAKQSLKDFLGDIDGKKCLDIGNGSGIFSLSMYLLGAKKIISFDVDPFSVQCAEFLRSKIKHPEIWDVYTASILDDKFTSSLGKFEIVYSWGVLHHTGKMWKAIEMATSLVKEGGFFFISIYNKTRSSKNWLLMKKLYNRSPKIGRMLFNSIYYLILFYPPLLKLRNPFRSMKDSNKRRGMNVFIDIKDWLGGYPYEYASANEIIEFVKKFDFKLKKIKLEKLNGCNEFLFEKIS